MLDTDRGRFYALVGDVYAFYRTDASKFALNVWWEAMRPFDFEAVARALNMHAVNPDGGQFLPKPADVVKLLQGGTQDQAMRAWTKVDQAVRRVGQYQDVVFDDALIHAVVADMGGWIRMGERREDEWDFVRNEFVNRYRGYALRGESPQYPPMLIGITGAHNRKGNFRLDPPVLVGDEEKAKAVLRGGSDKPRLSIKPMEALPGQVVMLPGKEDAA